MAEEEQEATTVRPVSAFSLNGRKTHSIVCEFEGTLLISDDPFPYFMIVALEAGGLLRSILLFLLYPLLSILTVFNLKEFALVISIFVSTAGLRTSEVKAAAKSNLSRFYLEELEKGAFMVVRSCGGRKHVVTGFPTIMVEPFLREYLDVDCVIGTEIRTTGDGRYYLGLVDSPGIMNWVRASDRINQKSDLFRPSIDVGLCRTTSSLQNQRNSLMSLCKEKYVRRKEGKKKEEEGMIMNPLPRNLYPKPLIFHDGRLVPKPTPLNVLILFLWFPLGFCLAFIRLMIGILLPYNLILCAAAITGVRIRADFSDGTRPNKLLSKSKETGTLYVCSHRTLLDPVMISYVLQRKLTTVTYSLSRLSEIISPIPNFRLTRDRTKDGEMMMSLLAQNDLVVCPEGTTCREPYLLRFSPLFAEIAEEIVPVAVAADGISMFYGTTVRGYKWLDSFFFLMNPTPCYKLKFLEKVRSGRSCDGGCRNYVDVANHVQEIIGVELGFECTSLTRRDKYQMIAGHDGVVMEGQRKETKCVLLESSLGFQDMSMSI